MNSPNSARHQPTPASPDLLLPAANGHPGPGANNPPPRSRPNPAANRRRPKWILPAAAAAGVLAVGGAAALFLAPRFFKTERLDLLTHKVRPVPLPISVVEKGTLESAENRDVICKVKAGSKGTFASTIKWVIDDGSVVTKGQPILELDDSALQDSKNNQKIVVEKARAEFIKADEDLRIAIKQNEADIAAAASALTVAELDLDKFLGYRTDHGLDPVGAAVGGVGTLAEKGEYKQRLDDVSARLKQSESDLDAMRERSAWAERSVKLGYLTPSQAKVETTKTSGGIDAVEKLQKEKYILENFQRQRDLTDLKSKFDVARIGLDKAVLQADSKKVQALSEMKTKQSVYLQEVDKLKEIEEQIAECKLTAPQDGMVVYYKPDSGRWGQNQQGLIAQGEQVKEGQKLIRIPDLRKMQVNTRVHEALVSSIRGDLRVPTGFVDVLRAGMLADPNPLTRLMGQAEQGVAHLREKYRDKEYAIARPGMSASVRVDAYPNRVFPARVKSVAAVASQADWMSSDVKVYQTLVLIEGSVDVELKPDMNSEVTIHVDGSAEPVLAVPIQAVVGGAEAGSQRLVYVITPEGPKERPVVLGKFNDKMIEVREGLTEGEEVVLNPKLVAGDKAKTREEGQDAPKARGGPPGGGGEGGEKKGKGGAPGGGEKKGGGKGGMPGGGKGGGPPA